MDNYDDENFDDGFDDEKLAARMNRGALEEALRLREAKYPRKI